MNRQVIVPIDKINEGLNKTMFKNRSIFYLLKIYPECHNDLKHNEAIFRPEHYHCSACNKNFVVKGNQMGGVEIMNEINMTIIVVADEETDIIYSIDTHNENINMSIVKERYNTVNKIKNWMFTYDPSYKLYRSLSKIEASEINWVFRNGEWKVYTRDEFYDNFYIGIYYPDPKYQA